MKLALYAIVSPLFVAFIALAICGILIRACWEAFMVGYKAPSFGTYRPTLLERFFQ